MALVYDGERVISPALRSMGTWGPAVIAVAVVAMGTTTAPMGYDEAVYLGIAREVLTSGCPLRPIGDGAVHLANPPLLTYVVAATSPLSGESLAGFRGLHVLLWGVPLWLLTWCYASRAFGELAGAVAACVLLAATGLAREAAVIGLDVPLATLTMALLVLAQRALRQPEARRWVWACGVVAASTVLVRYQGVFSTLAVASALVLVRARETSWAAAVRGPAAWMVMGTAAGLLVWVFVAKGCGGDLPGAVSYNLDRIAARSDEPWFHRAWPDYLSGSLGFVGPAAVFGATVAVVLRRRGAWSDPRLLLPAAVVLVHVVFCSAIALKAERYLAPVGPALAVLSASIVEGGLPIAAWLRKSVAIVFGLAAAATVVQIVGERPAPVNDYYRRIGSEVAALAKPDERVMLPHVQVAYFADRRHHVSVFEPDAEEVLRLLRDPEARITVFVGDDRILSFHPGVSDQDRRRIQDYIAEHFERVPSEEHAILYRRRSW